jgi:hypothetical protein
MGERLEASVAWILRVKLRVGLVLALGLGVGLALDGAGARAQAVKRAVVRAVGGPVLPSAAISAGASTVLAEMASHAGVIFTGQVVAVERSDAAGFVDVRFHIEQAVRGCPKSGAYVLREWAGLWTGHPERYRVGQRRLMLLTARGAGGMSSPVGGMDGAIPLVATGTEPLANGTGVAPADAGLGAAAFAVDLRWIEARGVRGTVSGSGRAQAQMVAVGGPATPWPTDPDPLSGGWIGPVSPLNPGSSVSAAAAAPASLSAVLAVLGSRSGVSDAARY